MIDYLDLAARGENQWWRYAATAVLAIALWLAFLLALMVGLTVARMLPADIATELVQPSHIEVFFGGTGVLFGALAVAFALAIRLIHGKRFSDVVGEWRWNLVARGAGLWLAVCILAGAADYLIEPRGFRLTASSATLTLAAWVLPSLAIQTFTEELIFRGYVTQALFLATRRPLVAALLSGLLFAVLHIPNGWPQAASAAIFGVVTALIAIRTAGIAFTFGLHLVNNIFGAVVVVSANDVFRGAPALVTQSTPNLMWLDAAVPLVATAVALWVAGVRPGWAVARVSPRPF